MIYSDRWQAGFDSAVWGSDNWTLFMSAEATHLWTQGQRAGMLACKAHGKMWLQELLAHPSTGESSAAIEGEVVNA
jgi:hypothetical protein